MTRLGIQFTAILMIYTASVVPAEASPTVEVLKIDGSRLQGILESWNPEEVTIQTEGETQPIVSADILRLTLAAKPRVDTESQTFLTLVDGTRIPHDGYAAADRLATIETPLSNSPLSLPTSLIQQVDFMPRPRDLLNEELTGDRIVIFKKKSESYDSLDGILGEVTTDQVAFTWDGDTIPVKRSKVAAIAYFHAKPLESAKPLCWLTLASGARLPISQFRMDNDTISVVTTAEINFSLPITAIQSADFSAGKLVYLSDLNPQSQQWTPQINLPKSAELIQEHGLPRRDLSYSGSTISLLWPHPRTGIVGGQIRTYEKGLALRSRTICRYRIPKEMTRFSTIAGIDPQTVEQGHVTLELFADERSVWQGDIAGGVAPSEINVSLAGARTLRIAVDFGENLDFGDRLHLAEARLSK